MNDKELINKAEQAKAIMIELCQKLDACYENHLRAEKEGSKKAAHMKEWATSEEGRKRKELMFSRKAPTSDGVLIGPIRENEEE